MVRYCTKCGKENNDQAEYCRHCGEMMPPQVKYRKPRDSTLSIVRIGAVLFGGLLLLVAFGLVMGGSSLRLIQDNIMDSDGYITSGIETINSNTYALVFEEIDIDIDAPDDPFERQFTEVLARRLGDLVTFKVSVSTNQGKDVFIGVVERANAVNYLGDVEYDRLISGSWEYDPWTPNFPDYILSHHSGGTTPASPLVHSFWVAHEAGSSDETLIWGLQPGNYWIVVMNEDGSQGVDVDLQIGVKVPILRTIGNALLTAGIIVGLMGVGLVYIGALRK
ncbi:MAG: zinc ribbon domain-containing protein [Candidatus Bathyarchaeota archaeon]|nr:zinc ribbon domain-containing protein [Candidatus Bathyarchaeota archaeon]